jgi:SPP1 family phage portal protein
VAVIVRAGETPGAFAGRRKIFIDVDKIDRSNIADVVTEVLKVHALNAQEIEYLIDYERGKTPIQKRMKKGRKDVDYKINENHAAEIKTFKVGYVFSSPITLVQRAVEDNGQSDTDDKRIARLNEMLYEQKKAAKDKQLAEDFSICGTGYRMALPKQRTGVGVAPFDILPLNPLTTCVGYSNDVYQRRMLGISYVVKADGTTKIGAYTDDYYYELEGSEFGGSLRLVCEPKVNGIGIVPIVEYRADEQRMGCFEKVLDLLDALCILTSDRVNGLSQFVQNILWADNVILDESQKEEVKAGGWLFTKSDGATKATIQYLTQQLDQTSAQSLVDWIYEQILQITGTPARGKSTGGNTGQAIVLSNGWTIAETAAKNTEIVFKDSEMEFLEVILRILARDKNVDEELKTLRLSDIDIKFSRNKTDSILVKVQALQQMIETGVDPLTSFKTVDLFSDPQQVWVDSKEIIEEKRKMATEVKTQKTGNEVKEDE